MLAIFFCMFFCSSLEAQILYNFNNEEIAKIDSVGNIMDNNGGFLGKFLSSGEIVNINNGVIGVIDGIVFRDINNTIIGSVNSVNEVLDMNNIKLGTITTSTTIYDTNNNQIGLASYQTDKMKLAALYFFLLWF